MTNAIIHADLMLNGVLKVEKYDDKFVFTNPGLLRLPVEQIYAGNETRARNQRIQNMFRMIGLGENLGSGFPLILSAWNEKHWLKPELVEQSELLQVKLEDLVYGNELIGFLRILTEGAEVSEDSLAEDVVDEVGPGGVFYMEEHTLDHLHDFWVPDLLQAQTQAEWEASGKKDLDERLRERVLSIIAQGPKHPLTPGTEEKLREIISRAARDE